MPTNSQRQEFRLAPETQSKLSSLAAQTGLSMSEILRRLIDGAALRQVPPADYYHMTQELHAIGNNLNQIARMANATGKINETEYMQNAALLRKAILQIQTAVELR